MKKAINRCAFPASISLDKCAKLVKEAGFDGIELSFRQGGEIPPEITEKETREIKKKADEINLEIPSFTTGLLWQYPLTSPDLAIAEKSKDIVKKALEVSAILGADTLLVVPGVVTEEVSCQRAYEKAQKVIADLAKVAQKNNVFIGIENVMNKMLLTPIEMQKFIYEINNPYVGVYLDVGNTLAVGFPEDWIRTLNKYIKKVHVKDFDINTNRATYLLEGDVKWDKVMKALKEVGYDEYLTAELSPYKLCPEELAYSTINKMEVIIRRFYYGK